jgi:hypothetical protein
MLFNVQVKQRIEMSDGKSIRARTDDGRELALNATITYFRPKLARPLKRRHRKSALYFNKFCAVTKIWCPPDS